MGFFLGGMRYQEQVRESVFWGLKGLLTFVAIQQHSDANERLLAQS